MRRSSRGSADSEADAAELRRRRTVRDLKLARYLRTPEQQLEAEVADRSSNCEGYCALLLLLLLVFLVQWAFGDTYYWFTHLNEK